MLHYLHHRHNKQLAIGLSVGLGAGIPSTALLGWLGHFLHTLVQDFRLSTFVTKALGKFRMDMIPNVKFAPYQAAGGLGSEVAESVDMWAENLARQGNDEYEAAEIMRAFETDMAAAEDIMPEAAGAESVADLASGVAGSASEMANSLGVQAAAQVASSGSESAEAIAEALLKAGVPADAIESTSEACLNAVKAAGRGWDW